MATAFSTVMNRAMRIEREHVLQAESHQGTTGRQGYANGLKPKTLQTRVGEMSLQIPQTRDYHDEKRKRGRSSFRGSARCSVARRSRPRNELRPLFLPWSEIHHPPAQFAPSGSLQTKPFHRAKACFFSFTHMARDLRIDCFMSRGSIAVLSQRSLGPLLSSSFVHPPRGGPWHCATGSFLTRPTPSPICSAVGAYPAAADHAAVVRHSPAWPRKRSSRGR